MARLIKVFDGVTGFGWFAMAAEHEMGWNSAARLFGSGGDPIRAFVSGAIGVVTYLGDLHTFPILLTYFVMFTAAGFAVLRRRGVAGPTC